MLILTIFTPSDPNSCREQDPILWFPPFPLKTPFRKTLIARFYGKFPKKSEIFCLRKSVRILTKFHLTFSPIVHQISANFANLHEIVIAVLGSFLTKYFSKFPLFSEILAEFRWNGWLARQNGWLAPL